MFCAVLPGGPCHLLGVGIIDPVECLLRTGFCNGGAQGANHLIHRRVGAIAFRAVKIDHPDLQAGMGSDHPLPAGEHHDALIPRFHQQPAQTLSPHQPAGSQEQ